MLPRSCAFLSAVLLPALLIRPGLAVTLIIQREIYTALEAAGALTAGNTLWGQILGRNIPTHPDWLRTVIVALSWSVPSAGVLWAGLWLRRRANHRQPRRGGLGIPLRLIAMSATFGVVLALAEPRLWGPVQHLCVRLADRLGTGYTLSRGVMPMFAGGPFDGPWSGLINAVYQWGPVVGSATAGAFAAHAFDAAAVLGLSHPLRFGECPKCGYDRRDVEDAETVPPCPECGTKRPVYRGPENHEERIESC